MYETSPSGSPEYTYLLFKREDAVCSDLTSLKKVTTKLKNGGVEGQ